MKQKQAFKETLALAIDRNMPELPGSSLGLEHLREMQTTVEDSEFSESKMGRWLGWAQCAVVASGVATLDEMKHINMNLSKD